MSPSAICTFCLFGIHSVGELGGGGVEKHQASASATHSDYCLLITLFYYKCNHNINTFISLISVLVLCSICEPTDLLSTSES